MTRPTSRQLYASALLLIQDNADPDVQRDFLAFFQRLVPDGDWQYANPAKGPDDIRPHVKAPLTQTSIAIPIVGGRLVLGTWQGIDLFEHRTAPHVRSVLVHVTG